MSQAGISAGGRAELAQVLATGPRAITPTDLSSSLGIDPKEAAKKLARWASQGWLRRVRRGLYIPVPVDALNPEAWTDDGLVLASLVWKPCYFTGWTTANRWGLTEQVFRTIVVKTTQRVRSRSARLLEHEYLLGHCPEEHLNWGLKSEWNEGVKLLLADPARTVTDILDNPGLGGGIRHVAEIFDAFMNEGEWETLVKYASRLGNRSVFKRLGYLAETRGHGVPELLEVCRARISKGLSLLDPDAPPRGKRVTRWGLRINVNVGLQDPS
jgi:predicted transcriptional regulator of viral defense system